MDLAANSPGGSEGGDEERSSPAAPLVSLLLFAAARQAAGTGREQVRASTLGELLGGARLRHGEAFSAVLDGSKVWVNGEPADPSAALREGDEVAVLPPVSGGAS